MLQIIKFLLIPSNLVIIMVVIGVLLFFVKKLRKLSRYLLLGAVVIYLIFATGPVSFWLLGKLEYKYPYLKDTTDVKDVEYIVVLAAYADEDQNLPLSSRVNGSAAFRLMEALKIHREIPESKIIISGSERVAGVMKEVLVSVGMDEALILIENAAFNTFGSAQNVKKIVGDKKIILVTSAGHMPRSMMVFRKAGMEPVPAPTDYLTFKNYMAISYLPSPLHLQNSDLAVHEYIGIVWYLIRGFI